MKPLRLVVLSETPDRDVQEFRASPPWIIMLLMGAVVGFCLWVGLQGGIYLGHGGALPAFIAWWVVFWLGLYWLMLVNHCLKSLKPSAWLVRADGQGLYIKWRSYLNAAWGADGLQAVFVPYADIAEARVHKRGWITPRDGQGGSEQINGTFLELCLRNVDTDELSRCLADDRAGKPGGVPVKKGRWRHHPVSLEPKNVLRIEWRASPGIRTMLELLRKHRVTVAAAMNSQADFTRHVGDTDLQELARRGELMTMIKVMRVNKGIGLEEAHSRAKAMIAEAQNPSAGAMK